MKYLRNVASLRFITEKCTNCAICVDVCPHGVFVARNKKIGVIDKDLCMECGACALNCKFGAIIVNAGVGCTSAIINGMITGSPPSCDCGELSSNECC
jgi:NAD-dependent dihydropyrimidine dehydrogenase PreA subunit